MSKEKLIKELKAKNYNCAQSFLCAYSEELEINEKKLFALAEGLDHGIAGMEEMCTLPIIMSMLLSSLETCEANLDHPSSGECTNGCAKCLVMEFKERLGSLNCNELKDRFPRDKDCLQKTMIANKILEDCLHDE